MAIASVANLLLPITVAMSAVTLAIGLCACPLQSLELQHTFVYCSVATFLLGIASLYRYGMRTEPYQRRVRYEFGLIPLVLFWGYLLCDYHSIVRVREASARTQMINNVKLIGLAFHDFHDRNKHLPSDIRDPDGVSLLSWRISICPFIEAMPQYQQFDQTKPWDSPGNIQLLSKMPYVYQTAHFPQPEGSTPWQRFAGPGTAFDPANAKLNLLHDFPDGTGNTILIVQAQQNVPWSKPADLPYGPNLPLPPLGQPYMTKGDWPFCCWVKRAPLVMMCMTDGTVRAISPDLSEETMRALIVRNDGKQVEIPD
jgi:hypothetical protein